MLCNRRARFGAVAPALVVSWALRQLAGIVVQQGTVVFPAGLT